jgi:hypothetical protein
MTSKKLPEFGIKAPKQITTSEVSNAQIMSSFAKWVPLICAGAAVGVSVLALKEIKNVRKELITLKKEQNVTSSSDSNSELTQKIELMDEQLRKITQYLANQSKEKIVRNVITKEPVKIINEEPVVKEEEEVEYEEVTDEETEDS